MPEPEMPWLTPLPASAVVNGVTYDVAEWEVAGMAEHFIGLPVETGPPVVWLEINGEPPRERGQLSVTLIVGDRSWTGEGHLVEVRRLGGDEPSFSIEARVE